MVTVIAQDISIEPMRAAALDDVIRIEQEAFSAYRLPPRTRANVEYAYGLNPDGCFVAMNEGVPVGFIFSRAWGSVGLVGTFGVDERCRGRGVGRRLLRAAVASLQGTGRCRVIGLETMAESSYNIGLYLDEGFRLVGPTTILEKDLAPGAGGKPLPPVPPGTGWMQPYSDAVFAGFDLGNEVDPDTVPVPLDGGFALVRVRPIREGLANDDAYVKALVLTGKTERGFARAIDRVERFCADRGFAKVTCPVNASEHPVDAWLVRRGFRVVRVAVRMVLGDMAYAPRSGIELSRWIM
jgi:ribosomal protein S18 acetylase RimI-like enzyme